MFKIRKFIHVSYSKNRDWKPVISQILTNVQEIFLVMWMLTVPTPLDHIYVHATLNTLEMDKLAQVILIGFLQSQVFEAERNLERPFNSNYGAKSSITFILKWSPTWFTPHQKWCIILFCPTSFENSFAVFCVVILYVLIHQNIFHHKIQLWVVTWCAWSSSDIDECSKVNICDEHASCSNTQGSYSCVCNPEYIGDGLTCKG